MVVASLSTLISFEYTFSAHANPFLDLLIRISNILSLGHLKWIEVIG
ncbi:hypothetical protein J2Z44_002318 [Clostridium punense]|uniref:Uncharacterized protein n=1 Tax=Clostridium punense TaxID=1054297 RepID=A0ABS4K3Y0_9CLOT|nr:hypothetical protein [Clostridium punense]